MELKKVIYKYKYLIKLIISYIQKHGEKIKIYNKFKTIILNLYNKFNINPFIYLEISIKKLIIIFNLKKFFFKNINLYIPILISYYKSFLYAIKILIKKYNKSKSLIYNLELNILSTFNNNGNCINFKNKLIKLILTYRIYTIYFLLYKNKLLKASTKLYNKQKNNLYYKKLINISKN